MMRKHILTAAVIGAIAVPAFVAPRIADAQAVGDRCGLSVECSLQRDNTMIQRWQARVDRDHQMNNIQDISFAQIRLRDWREQREVDQATYQKGGTTPVVPGVYSDAPAPGVAPEHGGQTGHLHGW